MGRWRWRVRRFVCAPVSHLSHAALAHSATRDEECDNAGTTHKILREHADTMFAVNVRSLSNVQLTASFHPPKPVQALAKSC